MKQDLTEIIVVMDKSGSMGSTRDDAIGGFNTFIGEQKKVDGEAKVTLTMFDTAYNIVHDGIPLQDVPELTGYDYVPGGMTALLDAMGRTIDAVGSRLATTPDEEKPEKVIMVIITDGEENSSTEYTHAMVMDKVNHQRDAYKWEFVFLGANQDAIKAGATIGVKCAANYAATPDGTRKAYLCAAQAVSNFRTKGTTGDLQI